MPHIALPEDMPGITSGFAFRPDTAKPMRELAHILLHASGNDGFSSRDRELVAAFVSSRNTCYFCQTSHGAAAISTASWISRSVAPCFRASSTSSFVTLLPSICTCSAIASNAFSFSEIAAVR